MSGLDETITELKKLNKKMKWALILWSGSLVFICGLEDNRDYSFYSYKSHGNVTLQCTG
jgi:hypothetical protein